MVTTSRPDSESGSRRSSFGAERTVAIIGAGAAGVSAAHYLKQKGYRHITLYDKRPRVGGKCLTTTIDGRSYELGALVVGNAYDCIRGLINDAGLTTTPLDTIQLMDMESPGRRVRADYRHYARPFLSMVKVLAVYLTKYRRYLSPPGYVGLENSDLAGCTMGQWLDRHRLGHLKALLSPYYVSWGYGYLEHVSAAYVFKLLDFYIRILERIYLTPHKNRPSSHLVEGYQTLFQTIAEPFELVLDADITRVKRGKRVTIKCNGAKQTFEALILAAPFQKTLGFLDADVQEKALFGNIRTVHFYTVTATVENLPPDHLVFVRNHLVPPQAGHMVSWYRRWHDQNTAVFYLLSHQNQNMGHLVTGLRNDLKRIGARMKTVHHCDHWHYFPHVAPDAFAKGYYTDFEKLQGHRNTWYVGELLSFATVEHVVAYSRQLVDQYF